MKFILYTIGGIVACIVIIIGVQAAVSKFHGSDKVLGDDKSNYKVSNTVAVQADKIVKFCNPNTDSFDQATCRLWLQNSKTEKTDIDAPDLTTDAAPAPTGNPNQPDTLSKSGKDIHKVSDAYDTEKPPANDLDKAIQLGHQWVDEGKRLIGKDKKDPMG